MPLKAEEVKNALLKFQASIAATVEKPKESKGKDGMIIDVMGSKGGVGTTTIAVNLAADILHSDPGKMVAILDMNLLFGDIPIFLGMESPLFDWAEIARNISRLDSSFLMGTLYKHKSGLHVLPSPTSIFEEVKGGSEIITKLLKLMKTMFDYVVIDGGQDLGEMSKAILKLADRVLVVTLLNLPCLINVKRLRETFLRLGIPLGRQGDSCRQQGSQEVREHIGGRCSSDPQKEYFLVDPERLPEHDERHQQGQDAERHCTWKRNQQAAFRSRQFCEGLSITGGKKEKERLFGKPHIAGK